MAETSSDVKPAAQPLGASAAAPYAPATGSDVKPYKPPDTDGMKAEEMNATHPLRKTYPKMDPYRPGDSQPADAFVNPALAVPATKVAPQDNFDDPNFVPRKYKTVAENWETGKREQAAVEKQIRDTAQMYPDPVNRQQPKPAVTGVRP